MSWKSGYYSLFEMNKNLTIISNLEQMAGQTMKKMYSSSKFHLHAAFFSY